MNQRSVINKASKIRILKFSISFFSKLVQWWIEHYSTEATTLLLGPKYDVSIRSRQSSVCQGYLQGYGRGHFPRLVGTRCPFSDYLFWQFLQLLSVAERLPSVHNLGKT